MRVEDRQLRLGGEAVSDVQLNLNCRDEMVPILRALQHMDGKPELREKVLALVGRDVNEKASVKRGRKGLTHWQILVLASVRLGCNLNYDRLQDLAENHFSLRLVMGLEGWDNQEVFDWRRIQDNVCKVRPETIKAINDLLAAEGRELVPGIPEDLRADSFVSETNIHYPTDSRLIGDGLRKLLDFCPRLASLVGAPGWRQRRHLRRKLDRHVKAVSLAARSKGKNYRERLKGAYLPLFRFADEILGKALDLLDAVDLRLKSLDGVVQAEARQLTSEIIRFLSGTEHIRGYAWRRIVDDEKIPNAEKLFSLFEVYTELINRGKTPHPIEFGRRVLIFEDPLGFIRDYQVMDIGTTDRSVILEAVRSLQERLQRKIDWLSLDRGFHSPDNQEALSEVVKHLCLPVTGCKKAETQAREAGPEFKKVRRFHAGVESGIGALLSGNGLDRCRDRTEIGFKRYVALGILGRNLHVLGKLLIAQSHPHALAAFSKRKHKSA
jgi:hypothetical protein